METEPDDLSRELVKGAKQDYCDADVRRLTFIMPNQASAASWHANSIMFRGKRLQLLCPATMEHDDITSPLIPALLNGQKLLHYLVRVLANVVAVSTVQKILTSSVSCAVTSVTRG